MGHVSNCIGSRAWHTVVTVPLENWMAHKVYLPDTPKLESSISVVCRVTTKTNLDHA